jgi:hypothetical protein
VVRVADTDPAVDPSFGDHFAYINTSAAPRGKLFVFLPATDSTPDRYTLIETAAANAGFHSIGLAYPNGPDPVNLLCSASTDADCTTKIRDETYSGTDTTTLVSVNASNSVLNRLTKALLYLHAQHPSDGWNQFLGAGNSIRWDLIRVSGLSQGGGLAGYIAKTKQTVDRACFFSSPADWNSLGNQPAGWVVAPGNLTPASRVYGFNNTQDPIVPLPHIKKTWLAFGMDSMGAIVDIDATQTYAGTHEMTTSLGTSISAHTSTASDLNTPMTSGGTPLYLPVWNYTCFN